MARLADTSTRWSARFDAQYVVKSSRTRRSILFPVLRFLHHIRAVWQFVKIFSRLMRLVQKMFRWHAQHFYNFVHLIELRAGKARKKRRRELTIRHDITKRATIR